MKHRLDARLARVGDRSNWQARHFVSVVGVPGMNFRSQRTPAQRLPLGDRIDEGRVRLQRHADAQPVAINAGDRRPLGRLAGLLLDDRGAAHPLGNFELAGLDGVVRAEQPRHHIESPRAARDCAGFLKLARHRAERRAFLNDDIMRPGFGTRRPPQSINDDERGEDQPRREISQTPHTAFMMRLALVPPKPKLLLSTALTFRGLAWCGTRSTPSVPSLGLSRLSVGGTIWSRKARMQKMLSTAPAPPSKCPNADLVELIDKVPMALPNKRRTAPSSSSSPIGVEVPWALI